MATRSDTKTPTRSSRAIPEGPLIWVGPSITYLRPGFGFDGSKLPEFIRRYIMACPEVGKLLVPAADYLSARKEVRQVGSKLWAAAQAVTRHFQGGK